MRPHTLLDLARRNDLPLPVDTVEELTDLYEFTDFAHFIEVWILTTNVMRTADDFRQIVVDYAAEAAEHGAVYLEAIFSPIERVARGVELGRPVRGVLRRRPAGVGGARGRRPAYA